MSDELEKKPKKLNKKQELFCRYYVSNGHNAKQAAISAGYSKHTAKEQAHQHLTKLHLKDFITDLEKPVIEKLALDEDWVLTKLKNFSDSKITDYYEIKNGSIRLKDFGELTEAQISAIESIKETVNGIEIKLIDKKGSVTDIGKHLGFFSKNDSVWEGIDEILLRRKKQNV